jgi:hypothetical protein
MSMNFICECGCTGRLELLEQIAIHFEMSNCSPGMVTFICNCGAELHTGPDEGLEPMLRALRDFRWEQHHKFHVGVMA